MKSGRTSKTKGLVFLVFQFDKVMTKNCRRQGEMNCDATMNCHYVCYPIVHFPDRIGLSEDQIFNNVEWS